MTRRFKPPIYARTHRGTATWTLNLGDDERGVIVHMLDELRVLLTEGDADGGPTAAALQRLFPTAYPDDAEKEAEYQRLMREDLVKSRLVQIDTVTAALDGDAPLAESDVVALMQSVNAIRLVLGTILDVGEDDEVGAAGDGGEELEAERHLYAFLSWLLDWIVRSLQT
ncbi:DUF2017 family protein [Ilumatobacter nonamiensis]|uniref:DUF2017 family protein n=1 Tax=Ilumatobacter nonamiensis TaxID=467093 RepID=UPI00034A3152|nr:DUF2017 family protein [Ilumatobacter nonamiensis]